MKLPKARTENLLEQNLQDETLIYDLTIDKAFNLNETLTIVYKACGQNQTFDELRREHKFTDDFIYLALDELKRNNLLRDEYHSPFANVNRREVIKKVGLASMMVLPLVSGLVAPRAVNAASGGAGASSEVGNYDQACAPNPIIPSLPTCNNPSLQCVGTSKSVDRCCVYTRSGVTYYYSGETISYTDHTPRYYVIGTAPTTTNECAQQIACCDGSAPYGTVIYEPDTFNEYSNEELAQLASENKAVYNATYNCGC